MDVFEKRRAFHAKPSSRKKISLKQLRLPRMQQSFNGCLDFKFDNLSS